MDATGKSIGLAIKLANRATTTPHFSGKSAEALIVQTKVDDLTARMANTRITNAGTRKTKKILSGIAVSYSTPAKPKRERKIELKSSHIEFQRKVVNRIRLTMSMHGKKLPRSPFAHVKKSPELYLVHFIRVCNRRGFQIPKKFLKPAVIKQLPESVRSQPELARFRS